MTMVSSESRTVSFAPRHVLMKQGDRGGSAWLIKGGEVDIFTTGDRGVRRIASLASHHVVGEMALIDDGLRTATVVARTEVSAVELPRQAFERLFAGCEPFARYLLSHLINTIRHQRGLEIAQPFAPGPGIRSSEDSGRILERRVFSRGHVVFREKDPGEAAYLIQSGEVAVLRGDSTVTTLGPGRIFGEMALLRNARRNASAIVVSEGATTEIIRRREFEHAVAAMPKILQTLTRAYLRYLTGPEAVAETEKPAA